MLLHRFISYRLAHYYDKIESFAKAVREEPNESENLHQFRVNTRRARSLLAALKKHFDPQYYHEATTHLKDFIKQTNHARDLDVFIDTLPRYAKKLPSTMSDDLAEVREILEKERAVEYEGVMAFMARVPQQLAALRAISFTSKDTPAKKALKKALQKREKALKRIRVREEADIHHLRIAYKKYRYVLELLVLLDSSYERNLKKVKKIQDKLGRLQDMRVQASMLRDFADRHRLTKESCLALGKVLGDIEAKKEKRVQKLLKELTS